jgi:TetR/AcrR family transcriptional regulator
MADKEQNTEQAILEAAKKIFIRKGMEGARMQEIADEAGINKALLHYYFRSKDKLFEAIFTGAILKLFTGNYIDAFTENPFVPGFIMHELSRDPSKIVNMVKNAGINPQPFFDQVKHEADAGNINAVDPYHLIVNMLSMCIFPFVATPILMNVLFKNNAESYSQFIAQRKKEVPEFIINSIKKK